MAVVARKYKSRITYYAVNDWRGKQVAERIGANQREAALRDRTMKKEIKAGTYQPPMSVVARTTGEYIESWLKERTNAYAPDERRMGKLYLEPRDWLMEKPLDEVVPSDTDRLVKELRGEKKPDGSRRLSDKDDRQRARTDEASVRFGHSSGLVHPATDHFAPAHPETHRGEREGDLHASRGRGVDPAPLDPLAHPSPERARVLHGHAGGRDLRSALARPRRRFRPPGHRRA